MADLDVQPKRGRSWWPWLLLAVLVLAVVFFLTQGNEAERILSPDPVAPVSADTVATP